MRHLNYKVALPLLVLVLAAVAFGRQLGAREAREKIAKALGVTDRDMIHIKSVGDPVGGDIVVEATFDAAFHFTTDKQGNWTVSEVRLGDRNWESLSLIESAINHEKILRTTADLRKLAAALDEFRKDRGSYVEAKTGSALLDNLSPRYLPSLIRLDAWNREFLYNGSASAYRLSSAGADGKAGTSDDIVIENGKLVEGALE